MSSMERACVAYFTNAIESEKQSELSPVTIHELNVCLTRAAPGIRRHIKSVYNGDLAEFLKRYPESFQLDGNERIFLTSDVVHMHGTDVLEGKSVLFFKEKLRSMKAFHHSAVPVMGLRKFLGEAPGGVQSLFNLNYPGREIKRFFQNHPDVFGVSLSGNVYLVGEPQAALLGDCKFDDFWHSDANMLDSELSKDEADAVEFYRQVLNSPGIELQTCSIDSLFAQLCEAPGNVQRFLKKTYNEVNFLDFFNAHKSSFCVTTSDGQETRQKGLSSSDQSSGDAEFPSLPLASSKQAELHCQAPWDVQLSGDSSVAAKIAAIQYFEGVVKDHMLRGVVTHVDDLRNNLADAPLLVFSYFQNLYPYWQFDKFFLDHATYFSIDSSGVVELSARERRKAAPAESSNMESVENIISDSRDNVENGGTWHTRSLPLEKHLVKFFSDLLNLTCSYSMRVVKPETLLAVSACLHPRLSTYLQENYGKNIISFFQLYQNYFRVSKNGNICLAVEKESGLETVTKKQPNVLALEVFVSLMQLLEAHHVKAVPPEILWEFLPLTPPKVHGFLNAYDKDTLVNFLLKPPTKFAISKSKNIYLSTAPGGVGRDSSDDEAQDYHRASENLYEASALEFFVDLVKSLGPSTYPVPVAVLQENLAKASPFVKNYFEEIYPQDKFLDFFIKYEDFFFVLKPVGVVWLAETDREDGQDTTKPIECPFSSQPKTFCQVVGVIVADLLVKSPKPFSTVLGHLNVIKEQSSQELNKHQGKSKTEKLCSLVNGCFDMFKIAKDNIILSWPLKHHASLLFVLEEALAAICTKLATGNLVEMSTFYTTMRHKVERMFQCLVPDTVTMLHFLRKRDEFLVLNEEQFIALFSEALPKQQVEEIVQLVEVELNKNGSGSTSLASLLSGMLDESFEHPFTSSTVVQAILNRKNRFRLQDGQLSLLETGACDAEVNCETNVQVSVQHGIPSKQLNDPPVQGTGWIISLEEESGVLAATFSSSSDYAEVCFRKAALSPASTRFTQLCIGQEVEFLAVRETEQSEWNIVELVSARGMPYLPEEKLTNEQSDDENPSDHVKLCHSEVVGHPSEDDDSTNGDDKIFYSSASDSEPIVTSGLDVADKLPLEAQPGLAKVNNLTSALNEPLQKTVEPTAVCNSENSVLESTPEIEANTLDDDDDDDDWETPYDRRNVSLFTKAGTSNIWTKTGAANMSAVAKPQDVPAPSCESNCYSVPDKAHKDVQEFFDSTTESPRDFEASAVVADEADSGERAEVWTGAAIWDIDPVSETVETMRTDVYEQAEQEPLCARDGADGKASKGWDRELLTVSTSAVNDSTSTEESVMAASAVSKKPEEMLRDEDQMKDNSNLAASPVFKAPTLSDEFATLTNVLSCQLVPQRTDSATVAEDTGMPTDVAADSGSSQEPVHAQEPVKCASGAEATDWTQTILEMEPEPEELLDKAAVVDDSEEKALDIVAGGDGHQSLTLSSDWKLADVLPFDMLLDEQEVVHSLSATVVYLCPLVAVLVSRVRGSPVKLVLAPDDCTALQWPLLCVGQGVAVRAVGDLSDSSILRVVRLRPLRFQPEVRAPGVDASTQTISTGSIMSGFLMVD